MQMVKVQIPDRSESAKAMIEMSRRGRIDCYADDVYMIPEAMLGVLKGMGVSYRELDRGGPDNAEKTLRDTLTAHAQRRSPGQPGQVSTDQGLTHRAVRGRFDVGLRRDRRLGPPRHPYEYELRRFTVDVEDTYEDFSNRWGSSSSNPVG
jgi:hypothetical protein